MSIDYDSEHIDFSLSQKDTLILQRVSGEQRPEIPKVPRTPKKTRLERLPLSETTTSVMRAIRRVRAEHLPEYFEQTCDWRQHETAVICGSSQLTYQELDLTALGTFPLQDQHDVQTLILRIGDSSLDFRLIFLGRATISSDMSVFFKFLLQGAPVVTYTLN